MSIGASRCSAFAPFCRELTCQPGSVCEKTWMSSPYGGGVTLADLAVDYCAASCCMMSFFVCTGPWGCTYCLLNCVATTSAWAAAARAIRRRANDYQDRQPAARASDTIRRLVNDNQDRQRAAPAGRAMRRLVNDSQGRQRAAPAGRAMRRLVNDNQDRQPAAPAGRAMRRLTITRIDSQRLRPH